MNKPIKHIKAWQVHTLESDKNEVFKFKQRFQEIHGIDIHTDNIYVLTGTILQDSTDKLEAGNHTRTSVIIDIRTEPNNTYGVNYIYETANTIYKVYGMEGDTVIGGGDWGRNVMSIFY